MEETKPKDKYQVIARKWRPKTFADVTAQLHVVRALQNAIKLDKLPNAYIFSGIRGVGKTSIARILARSINCENGPTLDPCGKCSNCAEIDAGSSFDVIEIDAASNNGVDDIRDIREQLQYAPAKCRKKIYIVDEVHMLSKPAFNAFLKTLEEPPPHTLFVFATTELSKIPDTVLSRCQCFEFKAISEALIAEKLGSIAEKENIKISPGSLKMIARRADGSLRDAESLLDQVSGYSDSGIDEEIVGMALGMVSRDKIWGLLTSILSKDIDGSISELHELYYTGYDVPTLTRELFEAVRDLTLAKVMEKPDSVLEEPTDSINRMKEMVKDVSAGRLQQFYDIILRAESQSRNAGNPLSVLEMAIIKMNRLDNVVPVDEILKQFKNMPAGTAQPAIQPAGQSVSYTRPVESKPRQAGAAPQPSGFNWGAIVESLSKRTASLGGVVGALSPEVSDGKLIFTFPKNEKFVKGMLEKNMQLIESETHKVSGIKLKMELKAVGSSNTATQETENSARKEKKDKMSGHPLVTKAIDIFHGRPEFKD